MARSKIMAHGTLGDDFINLKSSNIKVKVILWKYRQLSTYALKKKLKKVFFVPLIKLMPKISPFFLTAATADNSYK